MISEERMRLTEDYVTKQIRTVIEWMTVDEKQWERQGKINKNLIRAMTWLVASQLALTIWMIYHTLRH